jgi:hypothetical protein
MKGVFFMKIMFKAAVFLIFLSIALVGCGAEDDARGFLLLNPGVTWYYDVDIQGEKLEMQVQVGETKNIAGKTAYPYALVSFIFYLPTPSLLFLGPARKYCPMPRILPVLSCWHRHWVLSAWGWSILSELKAILEWPCIPR